MGIVAKHALAVLGEGRKKCERSSGGGERHSLVQEVPAYTAIIPA